MSAKGINNPCLLLPCRAKTEERYLPPPPPTSCEALPMLVWEGPQGVEALVSRDTPVPLSPIKNTFAQWLGRSIVNNFLPKPKLVHSPGNTPEVPSPTPPPGLPPGRLL